MTAHVTKRPATYADLEAVPPHMVAEIVYGVLESHPRPTPRHVTAGGELFGELRGRFGKGRGGADGWVIMIEPELHLGPHVVVPDIAGWRGQRLTKLPDTPYLTIAPDWICEITSPPTARLDRGPKRRVYAEYQVSHLWIVDPRERYLEAFALAAGQWLLLGTVGSGEDVRRAPFDATSFPLDDLFPFDPPAPSAPSTAG